MTPPQLGAALLMKRETGPIRRRRPVNVAEDQRGHAGPFRRVRRRCIRRKRATRRPQEEATLDDVTGDGVKSTGIGPLSRWPGGSGTAIHQRR
jgi:hypothetical protein